MKKDKSYSHYLFIQAKKKRDAKNSNDATSITLSSLDKICQLLQCDISDVVEYKEP